jgi:UDP-2,3-diacylglucosamine pyrophosphatase LpxH
VIQHDAIVISDLHLGSENCEAKSLVAFLEAIRHRRLNTRRLILNGDVFDSIDFRRLKKSHWKVLGLLRKLSDEIDVIWVCGNHDGSAEIISNLLGLTVVDQYFVLSGARKILLFHGHKFDEFIERYPITTWFGDTIYHFLQRVDPSHIFAKLVKRSSKTFLRNAEAIRTGAIEYARQLGCEVVCCGHTHHAIADRTGPVQYFNSGCWTERPCTYLSIHVGFVELNEFVEPIPERLLTIDDVSQWRYPLAALPS